MAEPNDKTLTELVAAVRLQQATPDRVNQFVDDVFDEAGVTRSPIEDLDLTPKS